MIVRNRLLCAVAVVVVTLSIAVVTADALNPDATQCRKQKAQSVAKTGKIIIATLAKADAAGPAAAGVLLKAQAKLDKSIAKLASSYENATAKSPAPCEGEVRGALAWSLDSIVTRQQLVYPDASPCMCSFNCIDGANSVVASHGPLFFDSGFSCRQYAALECAPNGDGAAIPADVTCDATNAATCSCEPTCLGSALPTRDEAGYLACHVYARGACNQAGGFDDDDELSIVCSPNMP